MRARTHVWTHMRSHTCMGTHVFAHARMHMYGHTCVRTHAHMHMYGHTRAHTHSHAHTPAHAPHAHSPMPLSPPCRLTQEQEGRQRPHGGPVAAAGSGDAAWEGEGRRWPGLSTGWAGCCFSHPSLTPEDGGLQRARDRPGVCRPQVSQAPRRPTYHPASNLPSQISPSSRREGPLSRACALCHPKRTT